MTRAVLWDLDGTLVEDAGRVGMRSIGVTVGPPRAADVAVRSLADLPADAFERLLAATIPRL